MRILVTGGAGFIGSHLVRRLLDSGHDVISIDNLNSYYDPKLKQARLRDIASGVKNYRIDIAQEDALEKVFQKHSFDCIYHLAAQAGVRYSLENPFVYADANYKGTLNIFELARRHGIKRVVFASSSSVYGKDAVPFREDMKVDTPVSIYAASKRAGELLGHSYAHLFGMNITCLRFFTVYGPYGRPDMSPHTFTKAILEGKPITFFNKGRMKRDFTYVDDIVEGLMAALRKPKGFEIINLGCGNPTSLRDFVNAFESALRKKAKIKYAPLQAGDMVETYADIAKAKKLLGYTPKTAVEEGVERFVRWYTDYYSA
ncbi:MAG: NAD-dependent epimerase/dehydratase family protein [Parcubacteria group bacterium]|nr:NAD-dependent epimerase/dehydratase family protein [Parcubacteria group bacterium]